MVTDPISNFIISLKNAASVGKELVRVPYSEIKFGIASVLEKEGYITNVSKKAHKGTRSYLEVTVAGAQKIAGVKRVSKPSKRVYKSLKEITPVRHGYGRVILSTPQGIMTGEAARKARVGGEVLFEIW